MNERERIAIVDLSFTTLLERRRLLASSAFADMTRDLPSHVGRIAPFAVAGTYTYVREGDLTLAGFRGTRMAQLIERMGAANQTADDVRRRPPAIRRVGLASRTCPPPRSVAGTD